MPLPTATERVLERDVELATLDEVLDRARAGAGAVVLVGGEAGIGKSTLVASWLDSLAQDDVRTLVGWCDDFMTGRTLGPLHDVARRAGGPLAEAVARADTGAVLEAVLAVLDDPLRPVVLVIEDVHWADEATLDVIRFVGRRIADHPALLVLTFRDDELVRDHPLLSVLAALSSAPLVRVTPPPLTPHAIAEVMDCSGSDADAVARVTGGNPFFVTELARSEHGSVPPTVTDTVRARVRQLSDPARRALEQLSVFPGSLPLDLAREVVGDLGLLSPAERRGLLVVTVDGVRFRHELARRAVEGGLTTTDRVEAHRHALDVVRHIDSDDHVMLHHAVGAGDDDVVVAVGPAAAAAAFRAGSHRQADVIQRTVLPHLDRLDAPTRASLLLERAWTLYNLHRFEDAIAAAGDAVALAEEIVPATLARALLVRGRMNYIANHPRPARRDIDRAVNLVEGLDEPDARAEALVNQFALRALTDDLDGARAILSAAVTAAEEQARTDLIILALNGRWMVDSTAGDDDAALAHVEEARRLGRATGALEPTARTYTNLVEGYVATGRWDDARRTIDEAVAFYDDHDFVAHRYSSVAHRGLLDVWQGDWDRAASTFHALQERTDASQVGAIGAIVFHGQARLAVWRGDDDAPERVRQAWEVALASEAAQYRASIGSVRLELGFWTDRPELLDDTLRHAKLDLAIAQYRGHFLRVLRLAGHPAADEVDPATVPEPWRSALAGDWRSAASAWQARGSPYLQALELASSGTVDPMLRGLAVLDGLGAAPAARWVRRRLRELGARSVPRGPQPATRHNPAGLTPRQLDVLELLGEGLTNADIADRLVLSVRTVDHHVSAILAKLGVDNRHDAAAAAADLGVGTA